MDFEFAPQAGGQTNDVPHKSEGLQSTTLGETSATEKLLALIGNANGAQIDCQTANLLSNLGPLLQAPSMTPEMLEKVISVLSAQAQQAQAPMPPQLYGASKLHAGAPAFQSAFFPSGHFQNQQNETDGNYPAEDLQSFVPPVIPDPADPALADLRFENRWLFWATWRLETPERAVNDIHPIGSCTDAKEFWACYDCLEVGDLPVNISVSVFRDGVLPSYEHAENRNGGHFKIATTSTVSAQRLWAKLAFAVASEQIPAAHSVQGCMVVRKTRAITLQLWISNSLDTATIQALREYLMYVIPQEDFYRVKFCPHKYLLQTMRVKQLRRGFSDTASEIDYNQEYVDVPYVSPSVAPYPMNHQNFTVPFGGVPQQPLYYRQ